MILNANFEQYKGVKSPKKKKNPITILKVCAPSNRASKYTKLKLMELKRELTNPQLQFQHFFPKYE